MFDETKEAIGKSKSWIKFFEKRVSELTLEAATLPTVGYHRNKYLEAKRALAKVKEALEAEREHLESLESLGVSEDEMQQVMSPEQIADWKKFEADQDERHKREREAHKRRQQFRVIDGGVSED